MPSLLDDPRIQSLFGGMQPTNSPFQSLNRALGTGMGAQRPAAAGAAPPPVAPPPTAQPASTTPTPESVLKSGSWSPEELSGPAAPTAAPQAMPATAGASPVMKQIADTAKTPAAPGPSPVEQYLQQMSARGDSQLPQVELPYRPHLNIDAMPMMMKGIADRGDPARMANYNAYQEAIQKAQQMNTGIQATDRAQGNTAVSDILKEQIGKQPTDIQKQMLALEQRKQGFVEEEAARLKGNEPRRQAQEDRIAADLIAKNPNMRPEEAAKRARDSADRMFKASPATPGKAGEPAPAPAKGQGTFADVTNRIPPQVADLTGEKDEAGKPKMPIEKFAEQVLRLDKSGQLGQRTDIQDLMKYMADQYGQEKVDQYLKTPKFLGQSAERFHSGLGQVLGTLGMGGEDEQTKSYQARNALLNALGKKPEQLPAVFDPSTYGR